jgi:hypothetical protein
MRQGQGRKQAVSAVAEKNKVSISKVSAAVRINSKMLGPLSK